MTGVRFLPVLLAAWSVGFAARARAQESNGDGVSLDSAATIREALVRPRASPPADAVDVAEFPFRVALFPVKVVVRSLAGLAGLASLPNPPLPVRMVQDMPAWGLTPRIRSIGPRSGAALDLRFSRLNPIFLDAGYSIRGSQRYRLGVAAGEPGDAAGLLVAVGFRRDAQEQFWGIGPDSRRATRSDFQRDIIDVAAQARARVGRVAGQVGVAFEDDRIDRGNDGSLPDIQATYATDPPFGVRQRTRFVHVDLSAALDLVRRNDFVQRGIWLSVGADVFRGTEGTDSDFHRVSGEFRGYVPISSSQTLALRGLVEVNEIDGGMDIPFFHLARLGGSRNGPRGFSSGRFRDRVGVSLMAEWRYEIWEDIGGRHRLETFLLFDEAGVAGSLSDFRGSDLRPSYGFGMRLVKRNGLAGLAYLAFSEEGAQLVAKSEWHF